jgi:plastocyanin
MMNKAATVALVALLALPACNVNVDTDPEAGPTTTPQAERTDINPEQTPTGCAEVSSTDGAPAPVTMKDTFFEPQCLAMSSTQTLIIENAGQALHNFSIPETEFDIDVEPGDQVETDPIGDAVELGTYEFVCKYHTAQGMVGTITIE